MGLLQVGTSPSAGLLVTSSGNVGIGTTGPYSKLEVAGVIATVIATKTADYTVTASDSVVIGNPASVNITFTLPTAVGIAGRRYTFKNISATYSVIIDGSATETIDGALTRTLARQYAAVTIISDGANWITESTREAQIHFDIDGGGSVITTGAKAWVRVPFNMTITGWDIAADQSGSITIDLWNDAYGNFPPTVADTMITTGTKPALSGVQKNQDTTIDWADVTINAGEYIRINVDSVTTCTKVAVDIYGDKA